MAFTHDGCADDRVGTELGWLYVSFPRVSFNFSSSRCFARLCRLWNYNPANDDARGDFWNGENFSWFSQSRADSSFSEAPDTVSLSQSSKLLDGGGRLLSVLVRPYPAKVAGTPLEFSYEPQTGKFKFVYDTRSPGLVRAKETEIFLPCEMACGRKLIVDAPGLKWVYDDARQTLFVVHTGEGVQSFGLTFDPPLANDFVKQGLPTWVWWVVALFVLILSWALF